MTVEPETIVVPPPEPARQPAIARVIGRIHEGERALLRQHERKTSDLLRQAIAGISAPVITLGEILALLEDRSFGLLMLIFALPGCIPGPPALTSVFGIPLIIFSWQVMMGHHKPWLPGRFARASVQRTHLETMATKSAPALKWLETLCKPRMEVVERGNVERMLGLLLLILSVTLTIPLPGTNLFPSLAVAIISIGMLEKDGLVILGGAIFSIFAEGIALAALKIDFILIGKFFEKIF